VVKTIAERYIAHSRNELIRTLPPEIWMYIFNFIDIFTYTD